jgi:NADH-quinone oxidoreductase subunit J
MNSNSTYNFFIHVLSTLILFCSLSVIFVNNPLNAVLLLILIFFFVSIFLILIGLDFIALLLIIVYVGAVAVLFLFVVMMLRLKTYSTYSNFWFFTFILFFLILLYSVLTYFSTINMLEYYKFKNLGFFSSQTIIFFDSFSNIQIFGQILYNFYLICFLISGLILLVSMIGAIVLTRFCEKQFLFQDSNKQLSKSNNTLSFFIPYFLNSTNNKLKTL